MEYIMHSLDIKPTTVAKYKWLLNFTQSSRMSYMDCCYVAVCPCGASHDGEI